MTQELIDHLRSLETEIIALLDRSMNRPAVNEEEELWTSDQCAAYLGIKNVKSFTQYTASLPSFPDRYIIPSTRGSKRGLLRWRAVEVKDWALSHREKRAR